MVNIKASFISAIKQDIGVKIKPSKAPLHEFFNFAVRAIFNVHPNMIRTNDGLGKASIVDNDIQSTIQSILSVRPITHSSIKTAILLMKDKQESSSNSFDKVRELSATGITRFMALSRKSMKYGSDQLTPSGIVAELQNDYVTRVNVSKFSSKSFYKSREWKELRLAALSVCDKCMLCGASKDTGSVLHVDHIKPRSLWPELSLDIKNMQILCGPCNMAKSNVLSEKY